MLLSMLPEEFQASLPRSRTTDGSDLSIIAVSGPEVTISDGIRSAVYVPKDAALSGRPYIVPAYVEAGWFSEANCVTLSDGVTSAVYVPRR
jgi:hypothetical protein